MQSELKFRFISTLVILVILLFSNLHSNAQEDDVAKPPKKNWPAMVHKITELGLPQNMVYRIRRMNKAEMDSIKGEDYHENLKEGEDEYVLKVMLRFINGRIIGFVKKEPMMQSNQGTYLTEVDIPVEWCGMDSLKTEHCVKSEEEMALLDSGVVIKPRDWHQKLDANEISTDVVSDNVDLLKLLENKNSRKKLQSKKMTDSLSHLLQHLTGDDSAYVAKQLELVTKEYKEAQRRKQGGDFIDDSTISVITNGLTGADSLKAIKSYLATKKVEKALKGDKKYQKGVSALDSTTIASITKGLSGADSINALRNYLEPKIVKVDKKKNEEQQLDSATIASITQGLTGSDSMNAIRSYVMARKTSKANKEKESKKIKKEDQLLDSTTLASITKGLTGSDSVNAIRSYVLAAKSKSNKKGKRGGQLIPSNDAATTPITRNTLDSTSVPITAVVVASKQTKGDKKKKKISESVVIPPADDSTIALATKGLSGTDSINAIRGLKLEEKRNKNNKKKQKTEQAATLIDSSLSPITKRDEQPIPAKLSKKDRKKKSGNQAAEQIITDTTATLQANANGTTKPAVDSQSTTTASSSTAIINQPAEPKIERRRKNDALQQEQILKDTATNVIPATTPTKKQDIDILKNNTLPTTTTDSNNVAQRITQTPIIIEPKKEEPQRKDTNQVTKAVRDSATTIVPNPLNKEQVDELKNSIPAATKDSTNVSQPIVPTTPIEKKPFRKRLKVVAPPADDSSALYKDSTSNILQIIDSTKH